MKEIERKARLVKGDHKRPPSALRAKLALENERLHELQARNREKRAERR